MYTESDEHSANYLDMAEKAYMERQGPQSAMWRGRLEAEQVHLLAALQTFIDHGQAEEAQRLAGALGWFWSARGQLAEGRGWLIKALAVSNQPTTARAKALYEAGLIAFRQGDNPLSKSLNQESLAIARQLSDQRSIIAALVGLSRAALRDLNFAAVRAASEEGLALALETGDREAETLPLHLLAELTRLEGNYDRAAELYDQSLALNRELGNRGMVALEHHNKGYVALHRRDFRQATALFRESLRLGQELGRQANTAFCLAGLAAVAAAQGQSERAARLFGAAATQLDRLGVIMDPADQPEYDRNLAIARAGLDEAAFTAAQAEGRAMVFEQAVAYALQDQ